MNTLTLGYRDFLDYIRRGEIDRALEFVKSLPSETAEEQASLILFEATAKASSGTYDYDSINRALELLDKSTNFWIYASLKTLKGRCLTLSGDVTQALEELTEAYVYFKRVFAFDDLVKVCNLIAYSYVLRCEYQRAIENYERAIFYGLKSEKTDTLEVQRVGIAVMCCRLGKVKEAGKLLQKYAQGAEPLAPPKFRFHFHQSAALIAIQKHDFKTALTHLNAADKLPRELKREVACQEEIRGYYHLEKREYAKADSALKLGVKLSAELGKEYNASHLAQIHRLQAESLLAQGKPTMARKMITKSLTAANKMNKRLEIAACWRVLAHCDMLENKQEAARDWFAKALDLFTQIGAQYEIAATRLSMAQSRLYTPAETRTFLVLAREYYVSEELEPFARRVDAAVVACTKPTNGSNGKNGAKPLTFVANSPAMISLIRRAEFAARTGSSILLTGQTGTGKDVIAEMIHGMSGRTGKFVRFNAPNVNPNLMESEMFGHRRGSFTGAVNDRDGLFADAENGTFFLNEIADAPLDMQAKLLEVIETGDYRRVGETIVRKASFGLIAATNADLPARISAGQFRADLYHRLKKSHLHVPPLSDRPEDIAALVASYTEEMTPSPDAEVCSQLAEVLRQLPLPGNIRDLQSYLDQWWVNSLGRPGWMTRIAQEELLHIRYLELRRDQSLSQREIARRLGLEESTLRSIVERWNGRLDTPE